MQPFIYSDENIKIINKICRSLIKPGGNLLFHGQEGDGKKELVLMASMIMGWNMVQPQINKYND